MIKLMSKSGHLPCKGGYSIFVRSLVQINAYLLALKIVTFDTNGHTQIIIIVLSNLIVPLSYCLIGGEIGGRRAEPPHFSNV